MKKILIVGMIMALIPTIFANNYPIEPPTTDAENNGIYLGFQGGGGFTHYKTDSAIHALINISQPNTPLALTLI